MKEYPIPDWLYQVMKWAGLIACPALAVFYGTVAPAWGLPYADQIVITLNALGALIGILIGASQLASKEV